MKTLLLKSRLKAPRLAAPRGHRSRTRKVTCRHEPVVAEPGSERAIFDWYFPNAHEVCIAGTFNKWKPTSTPLHNCGAGRWILDLPLKPGRYEFRFLVDGKWADDPGVTRRYLFVN